MNREPASAALYTRRAGVVRGPFTTGQITRYILLGRIRVDDEISSDCIAWASAETYAGLLPAEISRLESWSDYQNLIEARMHADERSGERRRSESPNHDGSRVERRNGAERRCNNEAWPESPSQLDKLAIAGRSSLLRTLLLSMLLATLVFAWLVEVGR